MRLFYIVLLCTIIISCGNSETVSNKSNINVNAVLLRSYDTIILNSESQKVFDVRLSIINKSLRPISFWMMTCSWEESFIINNDYTWFLGHDCIANVPLLHYINAGDSLIKNSAIIQEIGTPNQTVVTTIFGLIYIDSSYCQTYRQFRDIIGDKSKWDRIIWSNPLYLRDEIKPVNIKL
jgi:hypothetical protein